MNSSGQPHNVIRGATQGFEMSHPLDNDQEGEDSPARFTQNGSTLRDQEWANELRKADQRSNEIRLRYEDLATASQQLEAKIKQLEQGTEARDNEILRLGSLYQGG